MNINTGIYEVPTALKAMLGTPYDGPPRTTTVFNIGDEVEFVDVAAAHGRLLSHRDARLLGTKGSVVDIQDDADLDMNTQVEFDGTKPRLWFADAELDIFVEGEAAVVAAVV